MNDESNNSNQIQKRTGLKRRLCWSSKWVVVGLTSGLLAGEQIRKPNQGETAFKPETNGWLTTLSATNKVFAQGEPIVLTLSVINASTNTAKLQIGDDYLHHTFVVIGPDGTEVAATDFGSRLLHPTQLYRRSFEELAPGKAYTRTIHLDALFALTNRGEHTVIVSRALPDRDRGQRELWVTSAPLTFQIIESKKTAVTNEGDATPTNAFRPRSK